MSDTPDLVVLLTSWELSLRAQGKSPATLRKYLTGTNFFIRWCTENGHVPVLSRTLVTEWISVLLGNGAEPSTAVARLQAVKRFSAWLVAEDELEVDALVGLAAPKLDVKVVDALNDDQLRTLIKACAGKEFADRRDEAIVRLMAETGIRAAETCDLTTADIDLTQGIAIVQRGKGAKGRVVPFGPQTGTALDRWLRMRRRHPLADAPALWLGERGQTFNYYGLYRMLKARALNAGIDDFHPHKLRNTYATRWLAAGGSEQGLMATAGWSNRQMMDRYTGASASARAADEARKLNLGYI